MSLRGAINAKCKDCIYDSCSEGTWREQVAACSAVDCPLWPYRPAALKGPLSDPPRTAEDATPEWRQATIGRLKSAKPLTAPVDNGELAA